MYSGSAHYCGDVEGYILWCCAGEQGSYVLSDDAESEAATETSIQMREHVGILVEQ